MKKLHLLCNAHIDPVWLWRWNEGLAEAISTFRVAADFCEKYDSFVFNHNEALLYEWVEKHEPELFKRIQKLVKEKKWIIMGGWYLQPDCNMLSGESFMEQIRIGREYFEEKFGVKPTTAINFDSFGHTRGLVQILYNAGYDSYIFFRPIQNEKYSGDFLWEGFDGSRILAHRGFERYGTLKGEALTHLNWYLKNNGEKDTGLFLWGVGNHGGGPSRIDLENLNAFISESDYEVIHSTAEEYINDVNQDNLSVVNESLRACNVGCYTTMARIKQANRRLENKIAVTEKIMSYAEMVSNFSFASEEIFEAKKALAFCQFHDILPGTMIKSAEEDALKTFGYAEEIVDRLYTKAFLKLCEGQKKANEGEIPIMVFNPHPYEIEKEFEVGFMLQNQNWNDNETTIAMMYDEKGNQIPVQNEKGEATFNLDWIKKISFRGKLAPSSVTRFDCKLKVVKEGVFSDIAANELNDDFCVENQFMKVRISRKSGLIDLYEVAGKKYIENSGRLEVYKDNEDPWGMTVDAFNDFEGCFRLMRDDEISEFLGYPDETVSNVRIIEDGDVRMKIQAFFEYKRTVAVVEYVIPKNDAYIDVNILMYSAVPNIMIKYCIDTEIKGIPYGETAFGMEELCNDKTEAVYQKWCGLRGESESIYIINRGIYGGSFTNNSIRLSLLRTPIYSAHPIRDRKIAPHDRFIEHIDMGERKFQFRITTTEFVSREAQIFNEEPQLLSFFPSGNGERTGSIILVDNPDIIISSIRKLSGKYFVTFYNSSDSECTTEIYLHILGEARKIKLNGYELKNIELETVKK